VCINKKVSVQTSHQIFYGCGHRICVVVPPYCWCSRLHNIIQYKLIFSTFQRYKKKIFVWWAVVKESLKSLKRETVMMWSSTKYEKYRKYILFPLRMRSFVKGKGVSWEGWSVPPREKARYLPSEGGASNGGEAASQIPQRSANTHPFPSNRLRLRRLRLRRGRSLVAPKRCGWMHPVLIMTRFVILQAKPVEEAEGDFEEDPAEGAAEEGAADVSSTTEAPRKKVGGVVRPFRSNHDLIEALKRRRQQASAGAPLIPLHSTSTTTHKPETTPCKFSAQGTQTNQT